MTTSSRKRREKEYHAAIRDILICSKNELTPFATVFSFPPENFEQQRFGTIFGIIKVDDHSEDSSYIANLLTSVIKKEYFGKPQRSAEESFEASLRKANLALAELVRHGATAWAGKINFAAGAIERNNLHFACLGNASIFLIREGEIAEISAELDEEKVAESHPLKTFSNTSSGKLEIGDKLIFTTHELMDIFSREELRQNASHFSREEYPGFLEISLRANSELAGTIVIDLSDSNEAKPMIVEAPVIGEEKVKKIDSFAGAKDIFEKEAQSRDAKTAFPKETPIFREIPGNMVFFNFFVKVKSILLSISANAKKINFKHYFTKISAWAKLLLLKIKPFFVSFFHNIKKIEWKEKGMQAKIVAAIAILAIASFVSVAIMRDRSEQRKLAEETTAPPTEPETALQNLEDVNVKKIETIEEIVSLGQPADQMTILGNYLYIIPEESQSVLKVDLGSKSVEETKTSLAVGNFKLAAAMPHLESLFFLTENNKIVSFTPINKNFQENGISLPGNLKAADMKTFLTYLYILDPEANQIYRYPRAEGGFGEMQNWLRSGSEIKSAKGFAINDDIFAAGSGDITAYLQGKTDSSINFEKPDVPLAIDKIFSEPEMEGIYVLDNKNHRIVKYSKEGKIFNQYFSADIVSIKDFLVDEKNKVIYLLKGTSVKKFSFE
ncbi:MAG: hypothetical protein UX02_C0002G0152 [Candidatus Moranbacteria bacterium GW2011_GWC1_45_18]|nr:MAG: hypothetical protein UT79_C0001G0309 [Candidatus Moranbacteria bacterium GW2011_GWC2_40_12]KKT33935.1 MAG: hypothetical protein UW19_C0004G0065 [Candidatus Moranbacteria bacterium GW2011_GWF2_44_10]KKT99833.1 MAG: hypothetical protein UX02_C0002G0152 [Candidatus Moranbacteria bacterium GW2011_GWC1_45_18]